MYDDHPDNLQGGETALINFRLNGISQEVTFGMTNGEQPQFEVSDGIIVEPKPGRLVLFSSGAENFHFPMVVKQGKRPTYHFWFKCKDSG